MSPEETTTAPREESSAQEGPSSGRRRVRLPKVRRPRREARDHGLDRPRLRRVRLITLAVLAIPLLLLTLLALKFVSMPLTQAWHDRAYDRGDHPTAIERLEPVWFANWFEPYLPHLTKGTDLLQEGRNAEAEAELRESLAKWEGGKDLNQPLHAQCKILNNLAIAIERQADEIEDPAARADRLFEAEELLAPCAGGGGGGGDGEGQGGGDEGEGEPQEGSGNEDSEATEGNGERIEEKRREADEQAGNDPDERGDSGGDQEEGGQNAPDPGDPKRNDPDGDGEEEEAPEDGGEDGGDPKEDELEERNRDAQGGDGEDQGGSNENPEKPW